MKHKGHRNPRFPKLTLQEAISRIEKLQEALGKTLATALSLAKELDYASLSGTSRTVLSSLSCYGLLEREGQLHCVSDLARRIVRPISESGKFKALLQASTTPALLKTISTEYRHLSGRTLVNMLIHGNKKLDESGAKNLAGIWEKNLAYIEVQRSNGRGEEDENGLEAGDEIDPETATSAPPAGEQSTESQKPQRPAMTTAQDSITIPFGNQLAQFPQGIGQAGYEALRLALKGLEPLIVGQVDQADSPESEEGVDGSD